MARLNTRGVAAINRNDYKLARSYFEQAYELDPKNAFALNNMGTWRKSTATVRPPTSITTRLAKPTSRA